MTICAKVYASASAVAPIIRRTLMSRLHRNIVTPGVIAKASSGIAIDQMSDQKCQLGERRDTELAGGGRIRQPKRRPKHERERAGP